MRIMNRGLRRLLASVSVAACVDQHGSGHSGTAPTDPPALPGTVTVYADYANDPVLLSNGTYPEIAMLDDGALVGFSSCGSYGFVYRDTAFEDLARDETASSLNYDLSAVAGTSSVLVSDAGVWQFDVDKRSQELLVMPSQDFPGGEGVYTLSARWAEDALYVLVPHTVWRVTKGVATLIAGTVGARGYAGDGGPATSALLDVDIDRGTGTIAVTQDGNSLYIAEYTNRSVRHVDLVSGIITTVVSGDIGGGDWDYDNAIDVELDSQGRLYALTETCVMRLEDGLFTAYAGQCDGGNTQRYGDGEYGDGGPAVEAELYYPTSIAIDRNDNLYIAEPSLQNVRVVYASP